MKITSLLPGFFAVGLCATSPASAAVIFNGSGGGGFGGAISGSTMSWIDDGSTITINLTKGAGNLSDVFVIYLDTATTGRTSIGTAVNDRADAHRAAISYMEAGTGNVLGFAPGFEATHAIAINTGFGGVWSIPAVGNLGNSGLNFVSSVNDTLTTNTQPSFSFSLNVADLGITPNSGATIGFVGTLINPFGGAGNLGFASNEGYGGIFPGSNIGQNSFTFSSALSYTIVPEPSAFALTMLSVSALLTRRSRSTP